jgi:hypothetical protein
VLAWLAGRVKAFTRQSQAGCLISGQLRWSPPVQAGGFSLSIEANPDPEAIGWNDQGEPVGNEGRCDDLKGRAAIRNVADGAVKCPTAETDRSGFKHAAPWCYPVLVRHRPKLRGAVRISNQGQPVRVLSSGSSRSRAADGVGALRVASLFELVSLKPNVVQAAYRAAKPRYQVRRFVP